MTEQWGNEDLVEKAWIDLTGDGRLNKVYEPRKTLYLPIESKCHAFESLTLSLSIPIYPQMLQ